MVVVMGRRLQECGIASYYGETFVPSPKSTDLLWILSRFPTNGYLEPSTGHKVPVA
jgi:hypothetical protein